MPHTRAIAPAWSALFLTAILTGSTALAVPVLPELGDTHGAILSPERAHHLGRAWLRIFRNEAQTTQDPLLYEYLHQLISKLIRYSEIKDRRLELVVVDSDKLNAFAVPGGIIGVHNGLFLYAENEEELAAVLAHELGHLQKKHTARSMEQRERQAFPTMAGVLAGILLAATGSPEAGMAMVYSAQAAGIESSLRYSRRYELEADHIGVEILHAAGMSPLAVSQMFGGMLDSYRFRSRPPEFLLTHPLTERRVAMSRDLATRMIDAAHSATAPRPPQYLDRGYFSLMRARVEAHFADNPGQALRLFSERLKKDPDNHAARYGYVLSLLQNGRAEEARAALAPLQSETNLQVPVSCAAAEIAIAAGDPKQALKILHGPLQIYPDNYPLAMVRARILIDNGDTLAATLALKKQAERHPTQPYPWLLLAESAGLSGDIPGVHRYNAEYLILHGRFEEAIQRLRYAIRLHGDDFRQSAVLKKRIAEVQQLQKEQRELL